jgi:hypothetical protein
MCRCVGAGWSDSKNIISRSNSATAAKICRMNGDDVGLLSSMFWVAATNRMPNAANSHKDRQKASAACEGSKTAKIMALSISQTQTATCFCG